MSHKLSKDLAFDRNHIWHPYTSATTPLPTHMVERASGVELHLAEGTTLIDGMASWWCAIHGYNHPKLNAAAVKQVENVSHVMFGGLTHQPAIDLCRRLIDITPEGLEHVFLADSGSISVEVAMKMAIQFWQAKQQPSKVKMLTLRGGYHGDTFAAMSVCDPVTGMHHLFNDTVTSQVFSPRPGCRFDQPFDAESLNDFRDLIIQHSANLAAVILEPIVQGAGGMWFYHPDYLREVRRLCTEHDVLLIVDEIATGFGRTGKLFACEWSDVSADILCIGKALTGGYMTLAATLTTKKIAHGISAQGGVFMHGPTFMGNPLACSVACASVDLLIGSDWQTNIKRIEHTLRSELDNAKGFAGVADIRYLGAIGVIEMLQPVDVLSAQAFFVDRGVWIRPFGRTIYIMPPYIIDDEALIRLTNAMVEYARLVSNTGGV